MKVPVNVCFLVILAAVQYASSLECNACYSTKSWEDCKANKIQCDPSDDQCIKVHFMAGGAKSFHKGCSPKIACKSADNPICKEGVGGSITCDISCCDEDNCNAGSAFGASAFLLLTCAVTSLIVRLFLVKA